ncbi:plastocyanin [Saccharothrix coeruleofusca]|uniref:DUF4175 domain-containing protein n=1 Tax=Saccharothrix coeruleofusca TaxID=33919 RepID=UPI001FD2018C|nr:DUF4175 domain-containing protein [Saccharothrix coeruleofusca]MBP2335507.1 plastocyanin [Saccharothrix coeruleofusca]
MSRRPIAALAGALLVLSAITALPASAAPPPAPVAAQVLTWTADNDITRYKSAPTTAVAGATTIVFENSEATGNTTGMSHTLTFDTETPGYNHDVPVNILANPFDPENGRHEVDVVLTPGKYRYYCAISGHSTMVGEFTVVEGGGQDTTPPAVSAEVTGPRDVNGDYLGSATVAVSASDAQSGVALVEYQVDDTGFEPYTEPVRVTAIGDHSVQFRATDEAGNTSPVGSVRFRVVEQPSDTTPPTVAPEVAGTKDANGDYVGKATVTLTATDADSGVRTTEYNLDGGPWTTYTAPVEVTAPGSHMVHYRATDNAGNTSPEGMTAFTIAASDTTPPDVEAAVTGDRNTDGDYVGKATVTLTATDTGSGVRTTEYNLDGGPWTTYTAPVEVTAIGRHTVHHRATDNAGNTSPEGAVEFTVAERPTEDTTPPEANATVTGDRDSGGNYLGSATVTITATDSQSGVGVVEYKVDDASWTPYTAPFAVTAQGSHTVRYRAADRAGNSTPEKSVSFTVVAAGEDACPGSDVRDTVVIGDDDTGVPNADTGNGCTVSDLIDQHGGHTDHGAFVRHVERVTGELVARGLLTRREAGAIVRAAARSDIGN